MTVNPKFVRAPDGSEQVLLDLAEFQALLDAASIAKHGVPDIALVIAGLKKALESREPYIDLDEFLAEHDAAHGYR